MIQKRYVTTLSLNTVETYASQTGHLYVRELLDDGQAKAWIVGRQLIDLIAEFPTAVTADTCAGADAAAGAARHSIASSRTEVGDEAHLLISAVRYRTKGRARKGVASNYIAERVKCFERVRVKLKPNKHFGLPAADKDVIMVGPGTGIAPFRAFVQERRATESEEAATGCSSAIANTPTISSISWTGRMRRGRRANQHGCRLFPRHAEKGLCPGQDMGQAPRTGRMARSGALFYVAATPRTWRRTSVPRGARLRRRKLLSPEAAEQAVASLERDKRYLQDTY